LWILCLLVIGGATILTLTIYDGMTKRAIHLLLERLTPSAYPESVSGPNATSDTFLWGLQLPRGAETLRASLQEIPPDEGIAFVGRTSDASHNLIALMVAYVSWRRPILRIDCLPDGRETRWYAPQPGTKIGGILLMGSAPANPAIIWTRAVGPQLTLARIDPTQEWTSYCP
jgi:hypothetical protein